MLEAFLKIHSFSPTYSFKFSFHENFSKTITKHKNLFKFNQHYEKLI